MHPDAPKCEKPALKGGFVLVGITGFEPATSSSRTKWNCRSVSSTS